MIDGVIITPLKIIDVQGGDVLHALKRDDHGFSGFGEAYFSTVNYGIVKAWKRHREMVLNLIVPVGEIRFVVFDDRDEKSQYQEIVLSKKHYYRLTVPPMLWVGFQGMDREPSILLNIASIPHMPAESDRKKLNEITYGWSDK